MKTPRFLLILLCLLVNINILKAQFVTIPDTNFVNWLNANGYSGCMNGSQMDTTCNAIVTATNLGCTMANIYDLTGLSYFDSLQGLNCNFNNLITLPALPFGLTNIDCSENPIVSLPDLPPSLGSLWCYDGQLASLPALPAGLYQLDVPGNQLTSLPALPASLTSLYCPDNLLTSLPALPPGLTGLYCFNNQLTSLPALPASMVVLDCSFNQLTSLPATPPLMYELYINDNPNLKCLEQINDVGDFYWWNTAIECFPNIITLLNFADPAIDTVPLCDVFNSTGCGFTWDISGSTFSDINSNCILENSELRIPNVKMNLYSGSTLIQQTYSDAIGRYTFDVDTGSYTIIPDTSLIYTVSCPVSGTLNSVLTAADSIDYDMNFALDCAGGFDIGVNSIAHVSGQIRPGNNATVRIGAGDLSNQYNLNCASGISGAVTIVINGPASYISSVSGALTPAVNGDTLVYSIADFGAINFNSDFAFVVQTDTTAQISQQVCFDVTVDPISGDNDPSNNYYSHCFNVVNSYDPNDKQVSPIGTIDPSHEWLTYTIRFQNTGNAPAQHIYILDTLDANLDESSIQLLSYSHEPIVQVIGNLVRFNFPNINLPDSTNDEPNSHGYVQYKVKLNSNLLLGTQINNTAYIYFDFNSPVQTNTAINTVDVISGVSENKSGHLFIYPNPAKSNSIIHFTSTTSMQQAELFVVDITGRKVFSQQINSATSNASVSLPALVPGIYQVIVNDRKQILYQKLVISE